MQNIAPNRNEHDTREHFNNLRGADLHPASVILYVGGGFWKREGINIRLLIDVKMHCIIAASVGRIESVEDYEVHIQYKVSAEQFIRQAA